MTLCRERYVQTSAIYLQLIMQVLNMLVSLPNGPRKRSVSKFYGIQIWIHRMCSHATFVVYDSYVHFFTRNEHIVVLTFVVCRWVVYNGEGYCTKGF